MTDLREKIARTLLRERHPCWSIVDEIMRPGSEHYNFDGQADEMLGLADAVLAILPDAEALANALEPFAATVPYENEPENPFQRPSAVEPRCRQFGTRERCFDCTHDDGCPSAATDEVVAAPAGVLKRYKVLIPRREDYSGEHREWVEEYTLPDWLVGNIQADALTAAIPAIRAQAVAEIVAWLREGNNHRHPDFAFAKVFANAIEQGACDNG